MLIDFRNYILLWPWRSLLTSVESDLPQVSSDLPQVSSDLPQVSSNLPKVSNICEQCRNVFLEVFWILHHIYSFNSQNWILHHNEVSLCLGHFWSLRKLQSRNTLESGIYIDIAPSLHYTGCPNMELYSSPSPSGPRQTFNS